MPKPKLHPSIAHIPLPLRMQKLPRDHRHYPVPFFVGYHQGRPDHRMADPAKLFACIRKRLCWLCGQKLGGLFACVIGPMCAVNRNTSEPPSHRECALYAVRTCPFLTRPHAHRREAGLPEARDEPGGIALERNPGVALVWVTRKVKPYRCPVTDKPLFDLGNPVEVLWYCEGRPATRAEVWASIESGLPALEAIAQTEQGGLGHLAHLLDRAMPLLPEV